MSGTALVVDTNIVGSARNRGETGFAKCRAFLDRIDRGEELVIVSTLTLAELRAGFAERDGTYRVAPDGESFPYLPKLSRRTCEPLDSGPCGRTLGPVPPPPR